MKRAPSPVGALLLDRRDSPHGVGSPLCCPTEAQCCTNNECCPAGSSCCGDPPICKPSFLCVQ